MAAMSTHVMASEQDMRTLGIVTDDARTSNARSCPPFRADRWSPGPRKAEGSLDGRLLLWRVTH